MSFYKPFNFEIEETPVIVYPCSGLEKVFDRDEPDCLENHLREVYQKIENRGEYNVVIFWDDGDDRMADVWIFDKLESWGSGPLVDVRIFRNFAPEKNIGVSAGDGLLLLGREEELRRNSASLEDWLTGPRAELPADIQPTENFYTQK